MRVRILRARSLQDAGAERPLRVGEAYDLPDVVAVALIANQSAVLIDNKAVMAAPENKSARKR
jgi:hypothetical protein